MSLADKLNAGPGNVVHLSERVRPGKPGDPDANMHLASIDSERYPGEFELDWRGYKLSGEFWDLSDLKKTIGFRLPYSAVKRKPRTVTFQAKWYGSDEAEYYAEWDRGGRKRLARESLRIFNQADLIIGHNVDAFDIPHLRRLWKEEGFSQPRPFKTSDTFKTARRLKFESAALGYLCELAGLPGKVGAYDVEVVRAALAGDRAARAEIEAYAVGDVFAHEGVWDYLRDLDTRQPNVWPTIEDKNGNTKPSCYRCGEANPRRHKDDSLKIVQLHSLYECRNCGAFMTGALVRRKAVVRSAA